LHILLAVHHCKEAFSNLPDVTPVRGPTGPFSFFCLFLRGFLAASPPPGDAGDDPDVGLAAAWRCRG